MEATALLLLEFLQLFTGHGDLLDEFLLSFIEFLLERIELITLLLCQIQARNNLQYSRCRATPSARATLGSSLGSSLGATLRRLGCRRAQGYLFHHPLSVSEVPATVAACSSDQPLACSSRGSSSTACRRASRRRFR